MARSTAKRKAADLFEDSDGDCDLAITVDAEYAKRFEHNKKRAELHRLEAKHPDIAARIQARALAKAARGQDNEDDEDDEDTDSSDEDHGFIPAAQEKEWAEALMKIKSKDPSIYDANTRLFSGVPNQDGDDESGEDDDEGDEQEGQRKGKGKTLRQILYDQAVVEEKADELEADTDRDRRERLRDDRHRNMAYDEEQRKLKRDLLAKLEAAEGDDEDEDAAGDDAGLTKKRTLEVDQDTAEDGREVQQMLDSYFGRQPNSKDEAFLHGYLKQRLWTAGEDDEELLAAGEIPGAVALPVDEDEDEEFLDIADDFERQYNFRSEEPGGHSIQTFPRKVESTARKEESKRKRQREAKQEREAAAKAARDDELKRLKNLKKKDVHDALSQLRSVAGKAAPQAAVLDALLNSDFDPDAWDEHMAAAFNDDYYNEQERENDILGDHEAEQAAAAWTHDADDDANTFAAVHKRVTGNADLQLPENDYDVDGGPAGADDDDEDDDDEDEDDDDEDDEEKVQDDSGATQAATRDKINKLLEEYYKLDYEDDIGGVKTRFRYRQVDPVRDTLDTNEILAMTDKELNAIVGFKRLAPYREDIAKVRPNYNALNEARKRIRKQGFMARKTPRGEGAPQAKKHRKSPAGGGDAEAPPRLDAKTGKGKLPRKAAAEEVAAGGAAQLPKKSRPGPALRRALKQQQLESSAGDAAAKGAEKTGAGEGTSETSRAKSKGASAGKRKQPASGDGKGADGSKVPKQEEAGDAKSRRLQSFAKLALPHTREGSAAAANRKKRTSDKPGSSAPAGPDTPGASTDKPALSKSHKKNLKRAQKRRASV